MCVTHQAHLQTNLRADYKSRHTVLGSFCSRVDHMMPHFPHPSCQRYTEHILFYRNEAASVLGVTLVT